MQTTLVTQTGRMSHVVRPGFRGVRFRESSTGVLLLSGTQVGSPRVDYPQVWRPGELPTELFQARTHQNGAIRDPRARAPPRRPHSVGARCEVPAVPGEPLVRLPVSCCHRHDYGHAYRRTARAKSHGSMLTSRKTDQVRQPVDMRNWSPTCLEPARSARSSLGVGICA